MLKKYIIFILNIFLILSFSIIKVNAADGQLSASDIEMECVYENGMSLSVYYSGDAYGISVSDVKLSNKIAIPYSSGVTVVYDEVSFAKSILNSATCPSKIVNAVANQWNSDLSAVVSFPIVLSENKTDRLTCHASVYHSNGASECTQPGANFDSSFFSSTIISSFTPAGGYLQKFEVEDGTALSKRASGCWLDGDRRGCTRFSFNLVNERIYINGDVTPLGQWAFKSEGDQAASKVMYAKLYQYKLPNGNSAYFVEKDNVINIDTKGYTEWENNPNNNYMCLKTANKEIDSGKNDVGFSFSNVRHDALVRGYKPNCPNNFSLYKEVDWSEAEESGNNATSICDIIPETALILAEIVNYARIIVPIFLIVLTGIDISRIVIAGNLEEELPKRRKSIIIRFIIALVFFFLPLFVQVIVSSGYGVDFGDVSCIWT